MVGKEASGTWKELLNGGGGRNGMFGVCKEWQGGRCGKRSIRSPKGMARRGRNGMDGNPSTWTDRGNSAERDL